MNVVDAGVAVLSMHSLWEVSNKADVYEAIRDTAHSSSAHSARKNNAFFLGTNSLLGFGPLFIERQLGASESISRTTAE